MTARNQDGNTLRHAAWNFLKCAERERKINRCLSNLHQVKNPVINSVRKSFFRCGGDQIPGRPAGKKEQETWETDFRSSRAPELGEGGPLCVFPGYWQQ